MFEFKPSTHLHIHLGEEKYCESKVSGPWTQHIVLTIIITSYTNLVLIVLYSTGQQQQVLEHDRIDT